MLRLWGKEIIKGTHGNECNQKQGIKEWMVKKANIEEDKVRHLLTGRRKKSQIYKLREKIYLSEKSMV